MKHPITLRIDTDLLEASRHHAQVENRTLTNFVETVLRQHIAKAAVISNGSSTKTENNATTSAALRSKTKTDQQPKAR